MLRWKSVDIFCSRNKNAKVNNLQALLHYVFFIVSHEKLQWCILCEQAY